MKLWEMPLTMDLVIGQYLYALYESARANAQSTYCAQEYDLVFQLVATISKKQMLRETEYGCCRC